MHDHHAAYANTSTQKCCTGAYEETSEGTVDGPFPGNEEVNEHKSLLQRR